MLVHMKIFHMNQLDMIDVAARQGNTNIFTPRGPIIAGGDGVRG